MEPMTINLVILTVGGIAMVTAIIAVGLSGCNQTASRFRKLAVIHINSRQKEVLKRQIRPKS